MLVSRMAFVQIPDFSACYTEKYQFNLSKLRR